MLLRRLCFCLLMSIAAVWSDSDDVRMPPMIVNGPQEQIISRPDQPITLPCVGAGPGTFSYEWRKDGRPLNLNDVDRLEVQGRGEIVIIKRFARSDEGYYQCKLSTGYGAVLSATSHLLLATVGDPASKEVYEQPPVLEGQPFTIRAQPQKSVPKPSYSWEIARNPEDKEPVKMILDQRIQMDDSGNLHFAYAMMDDALNGKIYKLVTFNQILDQRLGGSYTKITVNRAPNGIQRFSPIPSLPENTAYQGVVGRNVSLRCFFNANPEVSAAGYSWKGPSGSDRVQLEFNSQRTELVIRNVGVRDQGNYICTGGNAEGSKTQQLELLVQAAPSFPQATNRPQSANVTEGETATFSCVVEANPPATVAWFINAAPLDVNRMPFRMSFIADGKLAISRVCRDCPDSENRPTDLMVVQCNASNTHGYVLGSAYLNVLKKTIVTSMSAQDLVRVKADEAATVEFQCRATSDPSTPVSVEWRKLDKGDPNTGYIVQPDNKVTFVDGGTLRMVVEPNSTHLWSNLVGDYTCSASNSYSRDYQTMKLDFDGPGPKQAEFPWWILIIVFIILLLLLLLLFCCLYLQRNKGDSYPVDEKERKNGNDPEKEIADNGFQDYRRPEGRQLKGSKGSLGSSARLNDDTTSSLNEYGDAADPGRFTEDGSFVGAYTSTLDRKKGRNE